jgi:hypothetical protein
VPLHNNRPFIKSCPFYKTDDEKQSGFCLVNLMLKTFKKKSDKATTSVGQVLPHTGFFLFRLCHIKQMEPLGNQSCLLSEIGAGVSFDCLLLRGLIQPSPHPTVLNLICLASSDLAFI